MAWQKVTNNEQALNEILSQLAILNEKVDSLIDDKNKDKPKKDK